MEKKDEEKKKKGIRKVRGMEKERQQKRNHMGNGNKGACVINDQQAVLKNSRLEHTMLKPSQAMSATKAMATASKKYVQYIALLLHILKYTKPNAPESK